MTTHHTDEKKPALGGDEEQGGLLPRPMLPSSRRCVWIAPETDQGRWEVKEKMEQLLDRLNKALWVFDTQYLDDIQRRTDMARNAVLQAMEEAIAVDSALFEQDPEDGFRQTATFHFDSLSRR